MTTPSLSLGGPGRAGGTGAEAPPCSVTRLRRLALGELPEAEAQALRAHLETCARCQAALAELAAERSALERELPFDRFAAGVAERLALPEPRRVIPLRRWALTLAPLAAAALMAITAWPLVQPGLRAERPAHTQVKGGASAALFVKLEGPSAHRLEPGEALPEGAQLLLALEPAGWRQAAAALLEAEGPSLLYAGPARAGPLPQGFAWEGHGVARLLVRFSDQPIDAGAWLEALKRSPDAALPARPFTADGDDLWTLELRRP